jgi:hypothetical protein
VPAEREGLVEEFAKAVNEKQSFLRTAEPNSLCPLSLLDWTHFLGAVRLQEKSIGFLQILPVGFRAQHAFRNNMMCVLPQHSQSLQSGERPLVGEVE